MNVDFFSLTVGIALGAAFTPFWMGLYNKVKVWFKAKTA